MINSIKITNHNHVQDVELLNLSGINIFCGKNNAGKTTILNILSGGSEDFDLGNPYKIEEVLEIFVLALKQVRDLFNDDRNWNDNILGGYISLAHEMLSNCSKEYYFYDDLLKLTNNMYENTDKEFTLTEEVHETLKTILFSEKPIFPYIDPSNIIYIPANRFIDPKVRLSDQKSLIKSSGEGIVAKLFLMKNQLADSVDVDVYNKIKKQFKFICNNFDFDIIKNNDGTLSLMFTNPSGNWLDAQRCGLGLRDLLIILYFSNSVDNSTTVLIDEVETHIHPDLQRKLLHTLKESNKQFFITTHSNIFLDSTFINKIFQVTFDKQITISDATSRSEILNDLGFSISDNLTSDLIILCEGPTDKPVIEEFLYKLDLMQNYNIKIWPLGGDIMDQLDLTIFSEFYNIIGLIDLDPGSEKVRKRFINKCENNNIDIHRLERYSIENYFTIEALREVFKGQIDEKIKGIDPNKKLEDQINLNPKKNNKKIASSMALSDIYETDLYDFFVSVKQKLEKV